MRINMLLRYVLPVACLIAMGSAAAGEKKVIWPIRSNQAADADDADTRKTADAAGNSSLDTLTPPDSAIWPVGYGSSDRYASSMHEGTADLVVPAFDPQADNITPVPFDNSVASGEKDKQEDDNNTRTDKSKKSNKQSKKDRSGNDQAAADKPKRKGLWFRKKPRDGAANDQEDANKDAAANQEKTNDNALSGRDYPATPPSPITDMETKPAQFVPYEDYLDSYRTSTPDEPRRTKRGKREAQPQQDEPDTPKNKDLAGKDQRNPQPEPSEKQTPEKPEKQNAATPAVPPVPPPSRLEEETAEAWRLAQIMTPPTPAEVETYRQRLELRLLERYNNLPEHSGQVAKISIVLSKPLEPSLDGSRIRAEFDQLVYDPWGKRIPALEQEYYVVVFGSGGVQQVRSDPSIRIGLDMEKTYSEHAPLAAEPFRNIPEDAAFRPAPKAKMPDWWRPEFREDY